MSVAEEARAIREEENQKMKELEKLEDLEKRKLQNAVWCNYM